MLKRILMICLILCLAFSACAEISLLEEWDSVSRIPGSDNLYIVRWGALWGVADRDGNVLIRPVFTALPKFENGYAVVQKKSDIPDDDLSGEMVRSTRCGLMNSRGEITIPLEYDSLTLSADGETALVKLNDKYGYMTSAGETIAIPQYDWADPFTGNYAAVGIAMSSRDNNISAPEIICWGAIDRSGKVAIPLLYDSLTICENGLMLVQANAFHGFLNPEGMAVTRLEYINASPFVGDYAAVARQMRDMEGNEWEIWGVIDASGREVVPCYYDGSLTVCENGLARVRSGDACGFINMEGEWVVPQVYKTADLFRNGLSAVSKEIEVQNGNRTDCITLWGVVDEKGNEILPPEYEKTRIDDQGRIIAALNGERHCFEVRDGKITAVAAEE